MKKIVLAFIVLSAMAIAQQPKGNQESFEARKTKLLAMMEQNHKSRITCITAAQDRKAIKQCRQEAREQMKKQKEELRAKKQ